MYCVDYTAGGDNAHCPAPCMLCDNKDVIGFPTVNISWNRAGEKVNVYFEKYLIDNIAYFQIGESNDKPYEPARVCKETVICQEERGQGWL